MKRLIGIAIAAILLTGSTAVTAATPSQIDGSAGYRSTQVQLDPGWMVEWQFSCPSQVQERYFQLTLWRDDGVGISLVNVWDETAGQGASFNRPSGSYLMTAGSSCPYSVRVTYP